REFTARQYFVEHADEILSLFVHRLGEVLASGCWGLRFLTGEAVLGLFVFQVLVSVVRRDATSCHVLAFAGGAVGFYLGPVALLRGDKPTHYVFLCQPFIVLVAARGITSAGELALRWVRHRQPGVALQARRAALAVVGLLLAPLACLSFVYYLGA